jgi:hypothetical protein
VPAAGNSRVADVDGRAVERVDAGRGRRVRVGDGRAAGGLRRGEAGEVEQPGEVVEVAACSENEPGRGVRVEELRDGARDRALLVGPVLRTGSASARRGVRARTASRSRPGSGSTPVAAPLVERRLLELHEREVDGRHLRGLTVSFDPFDGSAEVIVPARGLEERDLLVDGLHVRGERDAGLRASSSSSACVTASGLRRRRRRASRCCSSEKRWFGRAGIGAAPSSTSTTSGAAARARDHVPSASSGLEAELVPRRPAGRADPDAGEAAEVDEPSAGVAGGFGVELERGLGRHALGSAAAARTVARARSGRPT